MDIKLTSFAHGGGCGCKIAPSVLEQILQGSAATSHEKLIVGNSTRDDAAVFDIGNGMGMISTTDFFTPIVDDPFIFGQVAAANAISDVYAMGGEPSMALAVLGWPVEKIDISHAARVLEGAREKCAEAGIPLAGGHSIDTQEPVFGLCVSGLVKLDELKRNDTAKEGDLLLLTKPLGIGVLSAALKRAVIEDAHYEVLKENITSLNKVGALLGKVHGVNALTDITGFGLLGHLIEMCEGSGLSAELGYSSILQLDGVGGYISQRVVPDATYRNWNSYSAKVSFQKGVNVMEAFSLLPDPQTNGGLLVSVSPSAVSEVEEILRSCGLNRYTKPVGVMQARQEKTVQVVI